VFLNNCSNNQFEIDFNLLFLRYAISNLNKGSVSIDFMRKNIFMVKKEIKEKHLIEKFSSILV
jgi:hypothetical protein